MPYIRDSFFAGRDFASLAQMQAEALRWATEVYGVHKHRGLDGQTPAIGVRRPRAECADAVAAQGL